ncbi:MAG: 3-hydroxyacyl-CoA dehydrogenase NAD-binding domain-containing protein [Planctomycetota bacterium]
MGNLPIIKVLIIGSGWVGRQIAAKMAICGLNVTLFDRNNAALEDSKQWIFHSIKTSQAAPRQTDSLDETSIESAELILDRLDWIRELPNTETAMSDYQLVLESVSEQLSVKKRVLRKVSSILHEDTILASNSSYFVPSLLSEFVQGPERYAHMHFHVPVLRDSVADIVGTRQTNQQVIERLKELALRLGMRPLMLRKEHPGYVFNWMLQSLLRSALELAARDVVDPEEIDDAWKSVTGMGLGPFAMMDQIGLDVIEQVLANARWANESPVESEVLLRMIREKTDSGLLGRKTQEGFYKYSDDSSLI